MKLPFKRARTPEETRYQILLISTREYAGVSYWKVETTLKGSSKDPLQISYNAIRFKNGKLRLEIVENLNSIPLDALRELNSQMALKRYEINLEWGSNTFHIEYPLIFINQPRLAADLLKPDSIYFEKPMRSTVSLDDYISDLIFGSNEVFTFFTRDEYQISEGGVPRPRARPSITYVLDGEFYVVYGGFVASRYIPEEELNIAKSRLEKLNPWKTQIDDIKLGLGKLLLAADDEILQKLHQWRTPGEWLKERLQNSVIFRDEVWKYHVREKRWELLLPAISLTTDVPERPQGCVKAIHHYQKKKILYFCSWYIPKGSYFGGHYKHLFEFDYLSNVFKEIPLPLKFFPTQTWTDYDMAIDFSKNILVYTVEGQLGVVWVLCLETYRKIEVDLKKIESRKSWEPPVRTVWQLCFKDNYNQLILFSSSSFPNNIKEINSSKLIIKINWEAVKKEIITPFLEDASRSWYNFDGSLLR